MNVNVSIVISAILLLLGAIGVFYLSGTVIIYRSKHLEMREKEPYLESDMRGEGRSGEACDLALYGQYMNE